jgi:hypothetical protein
MVDIGLRGRIRVRIAVRIEVRIKVRAGVNYDDDDVILNKLQHRG